MQRGAELALATDEALSLGMQDNAVWCAEMLCGLSPEAATTISPWTGTQPFRPPGECGGSREQADAEAAAVSLLEAGEYVRAAQRLSSCPQRGRAGFLSAYAKWLHGEELVQQLYLDKGVMQSGPRPAAPGSHEVFTALVAMDRTKGLDAYGLWLYGQMLLERRQRGPALAVLLDAVVRRPLLWPAWKLIASVAEVWYLNKVRQTFAAYGGHWVVDVFEAHLMQRNYRSEAALQKYGTLLSTMPCSAPLLAGAGAAAYEGTELLRSRQFYTQMHRQDPNRVEDLDRYSNALFMFGDNEALGELAHHVWGLAPRRAESLCILGNWYSMSKCSPKAVAYFQRALQADSKCAGAWTFLGHEYSPYQGGLGNVPACIFAYQRALDLDDRDYRAWLGLAQIYYSEYGQPLQANYYAQQLQRLRPQDARLRRITQMISAEAARRVNLEGPGGARAAAGRLPLGAVGASPK
eukprot:TRINITY_DN12686_c0_g1_i1.p1 TRINITY_DN12686_c0_g1~~TRINITY_DN12686_c0_g1_i1.p1  ORF type:complete len:518 (+),score=183.43 TRINITY_DN12686_c0_g1_i1:163-1554(+)